MVVPRQENVVPPGQTDVLLAIVTCEQFGRRPVYGRLMEMTGQARRTLQGNLVALRDRGLVQWEDGKQGTIRSTAEVVR